MLCKNCNTILNTNHNYCHECGAKVIRKRLTLKNIFQSVSEQFFNYDSAIFRTFIHLITKPEAVIGGYINGLRKKYLNVIQYFAISLTITGLQFFIINTFFHIPFEFKAEDFGISQDLPNIDTVNKIYADMSAFMNKYISLVYILSIPISTIGSWLSYKLYSKKYNFTEHLVINTYYSAQLLIVLAFLGVICTSLGMSFMDFSFYCIPLNFIYLWYVLKRLYKQKLIESLGYFFVYGIFYVITYTVLVVIGFLLGILIGMLFY